MDVQAAIGFLKDTFNEWNEDKAPRLGAALDFYSMFSIGPLVLIAIAIASFFFGPEGVQGEVHKTLAGMMGPEGAEAIDTMVENSHKTGGGVIATIFGVGMLLFGASGVLGQLKDALNTIWEVAPNPERGIWGTVQDRFLSVSMVLGVGFLLMVSLILSTALSALSSYAGRLLPGVDWLWSALHMVVAFGLITVLFALMFKYLPDVKMRWRDVWIGAVTTAALFTLGKFAIGLYLGNSAVGSVYGAAGSLVVVLIWVYYSAQIFFFGAEMTQVYARRYGMGIEPDRGAVPLTDKARAQQGMPRKTERPHHGPAPHPGPRPPAKGG